MSILGSNGTAFDGSAGGGSGQGSCDPTPVVGCVWCRLHRPAAVAVPVDLYVDDLERAMDGASDWVRVGRP